MEDTKRISCKRCLFAIYIVQERDVSQSECDLNVRKTPLWKRTENPWTLAPDLNAAVPMFFNTNITKHQKRYVRRYSILNSWYQLFALDFNFLSPSRFSRTKPTSTLVVRPKLMVTLSQKIEPKASALFLSYELSLYKH